MQRQHQISQRSQVARCTKRALVINYGQHVIVEKVDEPLYGHDLNTAVAIAEALHFQQEHQADDLLRHHLASTAGMPWTQRHERR